MSHIQCDKYNLTNVMLQMRCDKCICRLALSIQLDKPAGWTELDRPVRPVRRTSQTDQLDELARRISQTDQFVIFEALASSHIRRLTFQFVHCRSFRVRRRPCLSDLAILYLQILIPCTIGFRKLGNGHHRAIKYEFFLLFFIQCGRSTFFSSKSKILRKYGSNHFFLS